jgi:3-phenylpropionate/trans-cinnamate dioxygenase ferredoxin reductase subunit
MTAGVVIVGAGHGGVQAAVSLRDLGYTKAITIIDGQTALPYHRPALSKAFLKSTDPEPPALRPAEYFAERNVRLMLGDRATQIDRKDKCFVTASGTVVKYETLILALGARPRSIPLAGLGAEGVFELRTSADAKAVRAALARSQAIVTIGAGFIGLEFAAVAREAGKSVTVVDIAERVMARSVSPIISRAFERIHRASGVDFRLGVGVARILEADGRAVGVRLTDGQEIAADMVVAGLGIVADDGLAAAAGLATGDGILVDALLRTSDSDIFAIGDVARFDCQFGGSACRYESVPAATDQARSVAATIAGAPTPYGAMPWFWSDQGKAKLQIVGSGSRVDEFIVRGDSDSESFSVFGLSGGEVVMVESVNRAADHAAMRRRLPCRELTASMCGDETQSLRVSPVHV